MSSESEKKPEKNSVWHWFGRQDLGAKYGMVLGCLVFLTFCLGFAKLLYNRHRTKKYLKKQSIDKSPAKEELHNLNKREPDEGDLFGIRALESGFYGGVAQSRPATPISGGSSSATLVAPRSAYLSSSSRSSSDTGYLKPAHNNPSNIGLAMASPGGDTVDMHLVVPPSPTHPHTRDRDESRSPSPTGSTYFQSAAPKLELSPLPSSGLNIQTFSNKSNSPRIQVKAPSPIVTHPHSSAIFSQRGSVVEAEKPSPKLLLSPSTPPSTSGAAPERTFVAYSQQSANYSHSVPKVVVEDSQDENTDTIEKGKAFGREELFLFTGPGNGSNSYDGAFSRPNANSLARTSERRGDNRASTASFAEFYDSYYDNRLSMTREEDEQRI